MAAPSSLAPVSEAEFIDRVVRMGLLSPPATAADAMQALLREGICTNGARQWLGQDADSVGARAQVLAAVYSRLRHCPSPMTEWQAVRDVLNDDEILAALIGIGVISVRRYAKGERTCPDAVAARLHWLALLIHQLEGTYNAYGIRRWFQRPRAALAGQAPQDLLKGNWDPEDDPIRAITALAESASFGMVAS
ncbi:MAG: hypothetical protein VKM34_00010 [Cyanobacteriota bacterium]|nr:hypothetical protein [Cyanobacteriota bacterium]